ncbi:MAG: hypothetical protein IJQ95_06460 [Paludibacteraceae bacterium]|nr:hypothetical protein [Paludibacteraceae bacterium]
MHNSKKINYILSHWRTLLWSTVRDTLSWLFVAVTLIGSLIAFLPNDEVDWLRNAISFSVCHLWLIILALLLTILIAMLVNWPHTKAVYKDKNTDIHVIIECCDIFHQNGLKVIHVVDTFDTELDRIISPRTLHGAFLQYCADKHVDIDAILDKELIANKPLSTDDKLPGRTNQYPLGTVCPVEIQNDRFCCVAFTHLKPNGTIAITKDEYVRCLKKMWRNLAAARNRSKVINVAVMGNRFVDLPAEFSTEQKIDLMIQTFFAMAREKACCRTLRICIHPDNVTDIDFAAYPTIIAHLAKRPII